MKFTLTITTGDDTIYTPGCVYAAILSAAREFYGRQRDETDLVQDEGTIRDIYDNRVGEWTLRK